MKTLPIDFYQAQIVEAVNNNAVVIITAETGAGKSTRVPQFLLDEGYSLVVTQPRRLAARTVAKRVAQERDSELGDEVGFRTAYERQDSYSTRCLFVTDGLAMVRELMGVGRHQILVLDEVHEWNLNIEVLTAWAKRQIEVGSKFKLIVMSATLEAEKLSVYFNSAPIISVPGRCYPVEEKKPTTSERTRQLDIVKDVSALLMEGRNVLVFEPGKAEISALVADLKNITDLNAEVLPLHGELETEDQDKIFKSYNRPKCVIATNVAQTSITIEDIDAVVDDGTEKRVELVNGVEGLYLRSISLADRAQRKGRAGRCRSGIYIDHCPQDNDRREFPLAEIFRVRLDQTVLRLAEARIDAEELQFFHQPPVDQIHEAKRALRALGCMNENGEVTTIGRQVSRLPISVQYGRMIIEAEKRNVVGDIIDIAAILEQGGIVSRKIKMLNGREIDSDEVWREKFCPNETESNAMAQLAAFRGAKEMSNEERRLSGIFIKAYHQTKERRQLLVDALKGKVRSLKSSGKREDVMFSLCAGMVDHLYKKENWEEWKNGDDTLRRQSKNEILFGSGWLVGLPFDLEIKGRRGTFMLNLITMATRVNPEMLVEVAPQLSKVVEGVNPIYDEAKDVCISTRQTFFNDMLVKEDLVETPNHPEVSKVLAIWLGTKMYYGGKTEYSYVNHNSLIANRASELNKRAGEKIFSTPHSLIEWQEFCAAKLNGASKLSKIKIDTLLLPVLDAEQEQKVLADNPNSIILNGEEISLEYNENKVSIQVTEAIVKNCQGALLLPGGRQVKLVANYYNQFDSFEEARAYFEVERLNKAWKNKENEFSNLHWSNDHEKLEGLLQCLSPIEIAQKNDGEKIFAFPYISKSGDYFRLAIKRNQIEAEEATTFSLRDFVNKKLTAEFQLERVSPWYEGWSFTPLGQHFSQKITEIIALIVSEVNKDNFSLKISLARQEISSIRERCLSEYEQAKKLVDDLQSNYDQQSENQNFSLVYDEAYHIRQLINDSYSALNRANYVEVQQFVAEAEKSLENFPSLINERQKEQEASIARQAAEEKNKRQQSKVWHNNVGSSNDVMAEALRRAGLIK